MARYRRVDVRIHFDQRVERLSPIPPCGEGLWHYLLTNPDGTMVPGLARCGRAAMAEALGWDLEAFDKAFGEVFHEGLADADWKARVVWVPNVIKYDPPGNPNVVRGWSPHWDEIPDCPLKAAAWETLHAWFLEDAEAKSLNPKVQNSKAFLEAFLEACPKPSAKASAKALPKPSRMRALRIQEQEQEFPLPPPVESAPAREAPVSGAKTSEGARTSPSSRRLEDDFSVWWERYPRKVGRKPSLEEWARLEKTGRLPPLAEMLERVELHKATPRWAEGTIPDPRTYLHQERWADEPESLTAVRSAGNGAGRVQRWNGGAGVSPDSQPPPGEPDPGAVPSPEPSPAGEETPSEVAWQSARLVLKGQLDPEEFSTWFAPIIAVPAPIPTLWCPTTRIELTLRECYGAQLRSVIPGGEVTLLHGDGRAGGFT